MARKFCRTPSPEDKMLILMINTVPISVLCDNIMPKKCSYSKLLYGCIVPFGKKLVEKDLFFVTSGPSKCERSKFSESANKGLSVSQIKKIINQFGDAALRVKSRLRRC